MRIEIVNHSDINGGASRAAYRIHHALRSHGYASSMSVNQKESDDWTVRTQSNMWSKVITKIRPQIARPLLSLLKTDNPILHSISILPSRWPERLNQHYTDILHFHWLNNEMMSIADIARVHKPIVWTLHDMWAFCGAEHYTEDFRWRDGYNPNNRPSYERGFDLNRWTWNRKRKYWRKPINIVTPSQWLANCVRESALMSNWPVTVVPNAIDTDTWKPIDKVIARKLLNLPQEVPLLLFGAMGGASDPRKGYDLLKAALEELRGQISGLELIIFGQSEPKEPQELGFPIHYTGHLHDDISLRLLYSAADAMIIPSRQDNLPNTGLEAHACGRPIIAFNTCGLPDIVKHQETGYLANPFDSIDLANGIKWVLGDLTHCAELGKAARKRAVSLWSYDVVVPQYLDVYYKAIEVHANT